MSHRATLELKGTWAFQPDPTDEGRLSEWFAPSAGAAWRQVQVPIAFDDCGPEMDRYIGAGWFRRTVVVPAIWRERVISLRFEGVSYNETVWVNGQYAGESHDAFLPFELPVGTLLRYGDANTITARIDNIRQKGQFPLFEGWFGQGGFLREAYLVATGQVSLTQTRITAVPAGTGGHITLTTFVTNTGNVDVNVSWRVAIQYCHDDVLATWCGQPQLCSAGSTSDITIDGSLTGIQAWSPAHPALYHAYIELLDGNAVIDVFTIRFGFRQVEARDGQILLNGTPIFLMGFNRHEDSPRTGMAVDLAQARADFTEMKRLGVNFVRLCHYPHHPSELDLCDELGLLVMTENAMNEWGHVDHPAPNPGWGLTLDDAPLIVNNGKRTLRKMVERDAHHPAVIICSVGNESEETRPDIMDGNRQLVEFGRALDPSRLWTHVSNKHSAPDYTPAFYAADDAITVNCYPTHHLPVDDAAIAARFADSTRLMRDTLVRLHADFPDKPLIIGEFGYPIWHGEAIQAAVVEAEFAGLDAPYVAGASLWHFAQHPWPADACYAGGQRISPYGYMSSDRHTHYQALMTIARLFQTRAGEKR